jgi:hypothetical protein
MSFNKLSGNLPNRVRGSKLHENNTGLLEQAAGQCHGSSLAYLLVLILNVLCNVLEGPCEHVAASFLLVLVSFGGGVVRI